MDPTFDGIRSEPRFVRLRRVAAYAFEAEALAGMVAISQSDPRGLFQLIRREEHLENVSVFRLPSPNRSFKKDSTITRRIAMREGIPLLGQSYVGVDLALERLRRMHLDSSTVMLHAPTEPNRSVMVLPVRFFSDSVSIGAGIRAQVAADGNILGFRSGPTELRRVEPFDMLALVDGFVSSMAPRMAAVAAATASRKETALQPAQLDRFGGRYSLGDATVAIARDSDHLTMQLPAQSAVQLLAMSATEFFVKNVDLVVSFESDAAGRVTGLTIAQGESRAAAGPAQLTRERRIGDSVAAGAPGSATLKNSRRPKRRTKAEIMEGAPASAPTTAPAAATATVTQKATIREHDATCESVAA